MRRLPAISAILYRRRRLFSAFCSLPCHDGTCCAGLHSCQSFRLVLYWTPSGATTGMQSMVVDLVATRQTQAPAYQRHQSHFGTHKLKSYHVAQKPPCRCGISCALFFFPCHTYAYERWCGHHVRKRLADIKTGQKFLGQGQQYQPPIIGACREENSVQGLKWWRSAL